MCDPFEVNFCFECGNMSCTPSTWDAEAGASQALCNAWTTSLGYKERLCQKQKNEQQKCQVLYIVCILSVCMYIC